MGFEDELYAHMPVVKATLWLTSKEHRLEELGEELLSAATRLGNMEDCPDASKKAGYACHSWEYWVELKHCYGMEQAFDRLYEECVRPRMDALRRAQRQGWEVTFEFVVHMWCGENPALCLSAKAMEVIASLHGEFGIDLYDYERGEVEDDDAP